MKPITRTEYPLPALYVALALASVVLPGHAARSPFQVDNATTPPTVTAPGRDIQVQGDFQPPQTLDRHQADPRWQFVDPLSVYMRTVWPDNVTSVRAAVDYLLEPTGYRLVTGYPAPREAALLVDKPLPPIARMQRTLPVVDALQLLTGLENYVVIDRAHRLVSFQKKGGGA